MADGKILYLVRHAEAAGPQAGQRDFDRPLDERGRRDAAKVARRLATNAIPPATMLSSPALRAAQTAKIMAAELGFPVGSIAFDPRIYTAAMGELAKTIRTIGNDFSSAMLIGHNPALTWLINHLAGEQHIANAPTGTIATLRTFSPRWQDTGPGAAELLDFDYPEKNG